MFKWLFKHGNRDTTVDSELAIRANIANKLRIYNADKDTTVSEFSLANDDVEYKTASRVSRVEIQDAWGQSNPREMGRWKRETRRTRERTKTGKH